MYVKHPNADLAKFSFSSLFCFAMYDFMALVDTSLAEREVKLESQIHILMAIALRAPSVEMHKISMLQLYAEGSF
ncbi:hypothetical protein FOPE_09181 [Fonsecaea pedrosoi]|nr:hypothetical protein FOPE_09181 [Fonsecaea pedrosoi]